jgi:hypothetical protein
LLFNFTMVKIEFKLRARYEAVILDMMSLHVIEVALDFLCGGAG